MAQFYKTSTDLSTIQNIFNKLDQFEEMVKQGLASDLVREYFKNEITNCIGTETCKSMEIVLNNNESLTSEHVQVITGEIKNIKVKMVDTIIYEGAMSSAIIMGSQIKRLCDVWSTIKDAQNLIEESKTEKNEIGSYIEKLQQFDIELIALVARVQDPNNVAQKKELIEEINEIYEDASIIF